MQKHYHVLQSGFVYEQNTNINLLSGWFGITKKVCGYVGRRGGGENMGYIIHNTFNEL